MIVKNGIKFRSSIKYYAYLSTHENRLTAPNKWYSGRFSDDICLKI